MNQVEYLTELKKMLKKELPRKEADEISNDYREYFETGLQEGKTEAMLIAEFGSPETVCTALLDERKKVASSTAATGSIIKYFIQATSFLLFCIILYIMFTVCNFGFTILPFDFILVTILPILLAVSGVYRLLNLPGRYRIKHPHLPYIFVGGSFIVLMILVILFVLLFIRANTLLSLSIPIPMRTATQLGSQIGLLVNAYYVFTIIAAILVLWLANIRKSALGLLFYPAGTLLTLLDIHYQFIGFSKDTSANTVKFISALSPFLLGIILSAAAVIVLEARQRKQRSKV